VFIGVEPALEVMHRQDVRSGVERQSTVDGDAAATYG